MSALSKWLLQRLSGVYFIFYFIQIFIVMILHVHHIDYHFWLSFMRSTFMQLTTSIALFLLSIHAWLGMRMIATDYIKCTATRMIFLASYWLLLALSFVVGIALLWR